MSVNKSSISDAGSYQEMGEFWDQHDLTEGIIPNPWNSL